MIPSKNIKVTALFPNFDCLIPKDGRGRPGEQPIHVHLLSGVAFKNNCLAEMWSGSKESLYVSPIDCCITQI